MKYLHQILRIALLSFLGEVLNDLLPWPIPASIYGMGLLFVALSLKIIRVEQVKDVGNFLVSFLPVLFVAPIVSLLNSLLAPMLAIVGALGGLYCVVLGVKYAKAEEPQEREKAKGALKSAVIGFVLIFVLILALNLLMPIMIDWVNQSAKSTIIPKK